MRSTVSPKKTIRLVAAVSAALLSVGVVQVVDLEPASASSATVTIGTTVLGSTPVLGYNIAHAMAGSNASDWWRYDGAKAARVFISVSDIEPSDDIIGTGDGVTSKESFISRQSALRANASSSMPLDPQYVNWTKFTEAYSKTATGNNRFSVASWFPELRAQGVEILVNLTASPSRFPSSGPTDYQNNWELWQHYYAQAFLLSREYGVSSFSMFNEPNNWTPAITVADWSLRLRITSDAIKAAVSDMNSRYGKSLVPKVLAPNTANGATKYDGGTAGDTWGQQAVRERNLDIWGVQKPDGAANFDVYNYQKYSMNSATYAEDYDSLVNKITADVPSGFPMALTEYQVRTGADYDTRPETGDSPSDYSALGANSVTLAAKGASQLYLFKYGMTERAGGAYPVAKNGTHYVQNATTGVNNYGGAAGSAEAYRLFIKASGINSDRLSTTSTLGLGVAIQATRKGQGSPLHVYLANTNATPAQVELDFSSLGIPDGSVATVEEVSTTSHGAIVRQLNSAAGHLSAGTMPAQSIWLVSVYPQLEKITNIVAVADATLTDGSSRQVANGASVGLTARADGTANGRSVVIMRFPVPTSWQINQRVLLSLRSSTSTGTQPTQAHVYGLTNDSWSERTITFSTLTAALKQYIPSGNTIASNVVAGQGTATTILGQLMANSTTASEKILDVTSFVKAQTDGFASFLIVQDHRWDTKLPEKTVGDLQSAGIRIQSKESGNGPVLKILSSADPVTVAPSFSPAPGSYNTAQSVTLVTPTPGATIRYTLDGSSPTATTGFVYSAPIMLSSTATLRALATATGFTVSPVVTGAYTITLPPPQATSFSAEFENLVIADSSRDKSSISRDSLASGGRSVLYNSNAIGDFITFSLSVPNAGSYKVDMLAKMANDRGIFQLQYSTARGGPWTNVDTPKDQYRSTVTFGSVGTFSNAVTLPRGPVFFRLLVTGKNTSSRGFVLNADRISFTPQ